VLSLGIFPRLPTETCALGSTQPLKMSTRKTPGSKAGRCVRPTTYHLLVLNVKKIRGLKTTGSPMGLFRPVAGQLYLHENEDGVTQTLVTPNMQRGGLQTSCSPQIENASFFTV
jgi:hypothetical protein